MLFVWVPALNIWVGKFEVTNGEYRRMVFGHNSKDFAGRGLNGERQPVVNVNFDDAKTYATWLTQRDQERLGGMRYRLISEQEWQTCAQCGDGREYPWGSSLPPRFGNYSDSVSAVSGRIGGYADGYVVTCPVELSGANEWGLYGLGGNVWECCTADASGGSMGGSRGASWNCSDLDLIRCAYRNASGGMTRNNISGFRLVLSH
jgi:formylglycine-generating enzyme required for sulfatase activity